MLKSLIAGLLTLLAAFGFHHSTIATAPTARSPYADTGAAQTAAADAAQQYPAATGVSTSATTPQLQDLSSPAQPSSSASVAVKPSIQAQSRQPQSNPTALASPQSVVLDPLTGYATKGDLASATAALNAKFQSEISALPMPTSDALTASAWAPSQAIDQLTNTTINNPTINGALAASNIPDLSGTYLSLANGGTVAGLGTWASGFVSQASSTIVGNFTGTGSGFFAALAATQTSGTSTIAAGQGFTIGGSQFVVQQGSGNVGIGTTAPAYLLDVRSAGEPVVNIQSNTLGTGAEDAQITLGRADGLNWTLGNFGYSSYAGFAITDANGFTPFEAETTQTNGDPYRVFFNRYGPTSTTTGSIAFHFSDTNPGGDNDLADFHIGSESGAAGKVGIKIYAAPSQTGDLQDWLNSSSQVLTEVTANGSIGIGTTSPVANLGLQGSIGVNASQLYLAGNGNVGIGTSSPNLTGFVGTVLTLASTVATASTTSIPVTLEMSAYNNLSTGSVGSIAARNEAITSGNKRIGQINFSPATAGVPNNGGYMNFLTNNAGSLTEAMRITSTQAVGIGTTNPYSRLQVNGPDTASTSAFAVVNSASTTVFAVYDSGNSTYSGSIFQSSDQRLKTDVQSLDASSSLSLLEELNPVSYLRIDQPGGGENLGFLAQQVGAIFPELVSTTSATALTPDGTLTLNYTGLIAPIVSAIQDLATEIFSLETTVAGFAQSFTTHILTADDITANNQLCVKTGAGNPVCITGDQLAALLSAAGASNSPEFVTSSGTQNGTSSVQNSSPAEDATDTPPVIQINGDNPATIDVGAAYQDLGVTITGPQADLNLGIAASIDGGATTTADQITIDTTQPGTHAILYCATDQSGLTACATRTVNVVAPTDSAATSSAL